MFRPQLFIAAISLLFVPILDATIMLTVQTMNHLHSGYHRLAR